MSYKINFIIEVMSVMISMIVILIIIVFIIMKAQTLESTLLLTSDRRGLLALLSPFHHSRPESCLRLESMCRLRFEGSVQCWAFLLKCGWRWRAAAAVLAAAPAAFARAVPAGDRAAVLAQENEGVSAKAAQQKEKLGKAKEAIKAAQAEAKALSAKLADAEADKAKLTEQLEGTLQRRLDTAELPTPPADAAEHEHAIASLNQELVTSKLQCADAEAALREAKAETVAIDAPPDGGCGGDGGGGDGGGEGGDGGGDGGGSDGGGSAVCCGSECANARVSLLSLLLVEHTTQHRLPLFLNRSQYRVSPPSA